MKISNKISKINFKLLIVTISICFFVIVPSVMAISLEQAGGITLPYALSVFFIGIVSAAIRFIQQKFIYFKRCLDVIIAFLALVIISPVVIICAGLVKLFSGRGAVLYIQKRVGKDGINFEMYKLRSMIPDAELKTGAVWCAGENDLRIIPHIGGFLRKTHIDEIPQLINVLKGEMSVVGPRPERPEIVEFLKKDIPEYEKRLAVRPGITGLAQIRHHYDKTLEDVKKKVKLDLLYIRKICLLSEISILARTLIVVITGKAISSLGAKKSRGMVYSRILQSPDLNKRHADNHNTYLNSSKTQVLCEVS
ncbi:MAG: sugar transferase [Candidatus Omnitrophota bacterium]